MPRPLFVCLVLLVGCQEYELNAEPLGPELVDDDPVIEPEAPADPTPEGEEPDPPANPELPEEPEEPAPEEPEEPVIPADHSDSWSLPADAPVDVVVFGDTSGSMSDELEDLGANIESFTNRLVAEGVDWRLMAINGDDGCGVDGWFDASTPDWQTRFADALLVEPDDNDEAGLQVAADAVENACNADFLRPDALLHVIFISDEEDQSAGHNNDPQYWQQYVSRIQTAKGGPALVTLSAVAGPTPNGCNGADAGFGYDAAVGATTGAFLSICEDWAPQLDTLAATAVLQDTFTLSTPADPFTIEVAVNGAVRPNSDWVYDAAAASVSFVANAPEPGDTVTIEWSEP
ncbi:MAG: hypothetical protein H6737_18650 [Alphaproteobacteria bacterium]|nr:hypothetical protein [Alphaproteobacteria bacterium]